MTDMNPLVPNPLLARILAIAILVTVLMGLSQWLLQPIFQSYSEQWQQNAQLEKTVARYATIIANEAKYKDSLTTIKQNPLPQIWYRASTVTSLGAAIQNDVRQIIVAAGASIDSMQSLPPTAQDGMNQIGISIAMRTDVKTLNKVMRAISSHHKLLKIDNISIRAPEIQANSGQPSISVKWDVVGHGILIKQSKD